MKRILTLILLACMVRAQSYNTWTWDVDSTSLSVQGPTRNVPHGDTLYIAPRMLDNGTPRTWPTNAVFIMKYQVDSMVKSNLWYSNTTVSAGTSGTVVAVWGATNDFYVKEMDYHCWIGAYSNGVAVSHPIYFNMHMLVAPDWNEGTQAQVPSVFVFASTGAVAGVVGEVINPLLTGLSNNLVAITAAGDAAGSNYVTAALGASGTVWRAEWTALITNEAALRLAGDVAGSNNVTAALGASGTVWRAEWTASTTNDAALRAAGDVAGSNYAASVAASTAGATNAAHVAASDPHGDRAYANTLLSTGTAAAALSAPWSGLTGTPPKLNAATNADWATAAGIATDATVRADFTAYTNIMPARAPWFALYPTNGAASVRADATATNTICMTIVQTGPNNIMVSAVSGSVTSAPPVGFQWGQLVFYWIDEHFGYMDVRTVNGWWLLADGETSGVDWTVRASPGPLPDYYGRVNDWDTLYLPVTLNSGGGPTATVTLNWAPLTNRFYFTDWPSFNAVLAPIVTNAADFAAATNALLPYLHGPQWEPDTNRVQVGTFVGFTNAATAWMASNTAAATAANTNADARLARSGDTATGEIHGPDGTDTNSYVTLSQLNSRHTAETIWYLRGSLDSGGSGFYATTFTPPATNWTLTIPTATTGNYGPSWIVTNAPSVINSGLIDISGVGASFNTGGGRSATLEWEAYITNTISGGPMPEWSDLGTHKVLTGTANDSLMTISVLERTNLPAGAAIVIRSRVAAAVNAPTITLTGGSNGQSSVSLPTGVDVNAVDPVARALAAAALPAVWTNGIPGPGCTLISSTNVAITGATGSYSATNTATVWHLTCATNVPQWHYSVRAAVTNLPTLGAGLSWENTNEWSCTSTSARYVLIPDTGGTYRVRGGNAW